MNAETVIEVAIVVMEIPDEPMGIREIARTIGRSPGGVSAAVKQLTRAGLLLTDSTPLIPDLFWEIATRRDLDRAIATLRRCPPEERACTVAVAPARYACRTSNRTGGGDGRWPLASHVVVALDLAQDRARGREIIESWEPPEGIHRAW